nr:MAG TPA: Protein of unknown function (DUF551) [Caudoviricetes sp.]
MSGWISVTDRLPERSGWYLAFGSHPSEMPKKQAAILYYDADEWDGSEWSGAYMSGYEVTHWMPMPEGPDEA